MTKQVFDVIHDGLTEAFAASKGWSMDMTTAPMGKMVPTMVKTKDGMKPSEKFQSEIIIAAGKCGVVTRSYWIPDEQRWCMFTKDVPPIAWQAWPDHPFKDVEVAA